LKGGLNMKLKRRKQAMKKKSNGKNKAKVTVAKPKKLKRASMATISTEIVLANPKASYKTLCKKVEEEFKTRGILSYIVENTVNDVLDAIDVTEKQQ
jgi:phage repressor protein C with HTH and peptisase S24 domain